MKLAGDAITQEAIRRAGGCKALADAIGVKAPAIYQWKRVPAARVVQVSEITGIPRTKLRPDIFLPRAVRS